MPKPCVTYATAFVLVLAAQGCDSDCDNPARLDGHYAVWSNVISHDPEEMPEGYNVREIFYNGWSEWTLKYIPAQESYDLVLDGQNYTASYTANDDNCNHFGLDAKGTYATAGGSRHTFKWAGDLMYYGSHLGGTWTYTSTWENPDTGDSGEVSARGEMTGTVVEGGYETGFGD